MDLKDYDVKKLPEDQIALRIDEAELLMEKCVRAAKNACAKTYPDINPKSLTRIVQELSLKLFTYYLDKRVDPKTTEITIP